MKVVIDTCALLYWTLEPEQLSEKAAQALKEASEILVSSISLWEISLKHERGRLVLPMVPRRFAEALEGTARVKIVSVDWETWLENVSLPWAHRDPADRTLVALARLHACQLVTSDEEIRKYFPDALW